MSNLVELSNELEFVPKEQLIQMSQDPNSTYPSYLVLSEIKRRTQMEKMYAAQQPKPDTTVSDELVAEFAGSPSGLGAMAQSSDTPNAFQSGEMGNMAPPSPLMTAASGGRTGYQAGGLFGPQNLGTFEEFKERMIGEYIAATGKSRKEAEIFANQNAKERYDEAIGNSEVQQDNIKDNMRRDSLLFSPNIQDALLNNTPLPESLQSKIDEAQEPSGLGKFAEAGTQFFFGDARPDADNPTLARATDEFTDYLNIIPGAAGIKLGLKAIRGGKALKQSGKLDEVIDLTKINPAKIKQADNILPNTVPKTGGTPPAVVPRTGGTPPTSGPPVGPPKPPGTNLVPKTGTNLVPKIGTNLVLQGGPLTVIPKVIKQSKGLMNRAIDFLKNNKTAQGILGIGGITTAYSLMDDADVNTNNNNNDNDNSGLKTEEIKRVMDPLDLAKLGGIIMGARNTSELGQGITALAGDIQERRYKEKVLTSKEEQMLYTRLNAISKAIDEYTGDQEAPEYKRLIQARDAAVAQINSLYGVQGTDFAGLLDSVTVNKTNNKNNNINSSNVSLGGNLGLSGDSLSSTFINPIDKKKTQLTPNPEDKGYASEEFLTGDPFIDNIMRIESSGKDVVNNTTGATGPMQVLPSTLQDPGYNIEPAKNDSVEEKIRVGEDYFYAMVDKYNGDIFLGTLAYNLGPGNVDTWLNSGGDINTLKSITSKDGRQIGEAAYDYVVKAYGQDAVNRRLT